MGELPDGQLGLGGLLVAAQERLVVPAGHPDQLPAGALAAPRCVSRGSFLPHLIDDVEEVLLVTGVTPPTLDQMAMASFIEDAALERHLRSMRRRYSAKRDILIDALGTHLPEVRISGTAAGLHLLAWLPDGADEHATAMHARRSGVGVHELHRHCTTHASSSPALVLGFALPSESELTTATGLLAKAIC